MTKIAKKSVMITGAAMGMGLLYAERSVKDKARQLILWDIQEELLMKTAEALRSQGMTVYPYVVDISNLDAIKKAAKKTLQESGPVDVLFNNAGIVVAKNFLDYSHEDIEKTIRINTLGVMHVALEFLPAMIQQGEGHLVNIASASGLIPLPGGSVYASSKWAVIGWSDSVRVELEKAGHKKVRVTTVTPSYVDTGMFSGVDVPLLTPLLKPEAIVDAVWKAVKKNKPVVRAPAIVNILPLLKGALSTRTFDFLAGDIFGVYKSMDHVTGRKTE